MQPMRLSAFFTNCYLFPTLAGYLLVDTGGERGVEELLGRLRQRIDLNELQWIFLTHAHADYAGSLVPLLKQSRARVLLHPLALERLRTGRDPEETLRPGRGAALAVGLLRAMGRESDTFQPLPRGMENRCIPLEGRRRRELESSLGVRFLDTPGHTADSMSLLTEDGACFCGDAAMGGFPARHHITTRMEDLERYRASWGALVGAGARMLYPGRGGAFPPGVLRKEMPHLNRLCQMKGT